MGVAVKIQDLVDMAVSPASMGPGLLKAFLHVIVNYMGLKDLKVEFRGADTKMIHDLAGKVRTDGGSSIQLLSTSSLIDSKESVGIGQLPSSEGKKDEVIVVENGVVRDPNKKRVSFNTIARLEGKVKSLQAQLEALNAQVLPTDDTLLQETRSKQEAKPITDLLQSLNITKRMSGAEEGLDKLASLLETIAKEYSDLRAVTDTMQAHFGENMADTMNQIKMAAKYASQIKPREELLNKYRTAKRDESTATDWSGLIKTGLNVAVGIGEAIFGNQPSVQPSNVSVRKQVDSTLGSGIIPKPSEQKMANVGIEVLSSKFSVKRGADLTVESETPPKMGLKKAATLVTESGKISKGSQMKAIPEGVVANDDLTNLRSSKLVTGITSSRRNVSSEAVVQSSAIAEDSKLRMEMEAGLAETSLLAYIPALKPDDKVDAEKLNRLLLQHEILKKNMEFMIAQVNTLAEFADVIVPELLAGMPHATELRRRIANLQKDGKVTCPDSPEDTDDVVISSKDLNERMEGAEARLIKHHAKLRRQDAMIAEKTLDLDNRIGKLTKSLADVVEVLGLKKHKHKPKEEEEMDQIFGKIGNVEEALIEIGCATQNLLDDKDFKMSLLENLTEEIKLIKTLKLDRFEMEDILASKADCDELNKKVPLERFDEVTNDLARGIDEALNKVSAQQSLVAATLLEMQNSLETKFDRSEVEELKEEFNSKTQMLKDELARLAAMKEGRVAAGGRRKFVTDVNCLSCDRNVAMATETGVPCIPALADLTHSRSIRPFITYELEYLRKMKIKDPEIIKYIEYEELFRRYKLKTTDSYEHLANVPHLKNRYCGGAHTVTGPLQKVPHTGHFDLKTSGGRTNV